ncbi:MAG: flagellar hook-length control protein FliK [Betaproteobacteria bacterium]|nr:flagellar hook-length control protein FliK [Betaproteobacteria bacterium]
MVLIPPDIGLRVRLQNELQPQPVTPLQEIPSELPELKAGQAFSARIQEVLPENTYRALVAGKSITLSLPESVKSGDVLDLVVIDRTPRTVIAQLAISGKAASTAEEAAYPHATFSRVGQMISALLAPEGRAPPAAELNQGQPLLAQPPKSGAELVPVLSKAVVESGLFYEAHQAQWIAGKLPLGSLLQEPQGQFSQPEAQLVAYAEKMLLASLSPQGGPVPKAQGEPSATAPGLNASPELPGQPMTPSAVATSAPRTSLHGLLHDAQGQPVTLAQIAAYLRSEAGSPERLKDMSFQQLVDAAAMQANLPQTQESAAESHAAENQRTPAGLQNNPQQTAALPDELRPLVQQQLDAAGTQRLLWHGEVWPGQTVQWQVEWDGERKSDANQGEPEPWSTTLRLTTPRLGEVEAALRLGAHGVHIALLSASDSSVSDLRNGVPKLEQALTAAGIPLLGLTIKQAGEAQEEEKEE